MLLAQMLMMGAQSSKPATKTYSQVVLADSPFAFWPLNETSGTVAYDISGNGNNGTLYGGITLNQALSNGMTGMLFDGATGYIDTLSLSTAPTTYSMEIWVVLQAYQGLIMGFQNANTPAGADSYDRGFYAGSNDSIQFGVYNGETTTASAPVNLNTVLYLGVSANSSAFSFYLNGSLVKTVSASGASYTPSDLLLGAGEMAGNGGWPDVVSDWTKGILSNAAYYSTNLSAQQFLNHYNAGIAA